MRINEGERLSETSLIRPQNERLNDSFGNELNKNQNSKIFNKTPHR